MNTQNGQLTIPETAEALNISIKTVRRWVDNGKLKAEKVKGKWIVNISNPDDITDVPSDHNGQVDQTDVQSDPSNNQETQLPDQTALIEIFRNQIHDLKSEIEQKNKQLDQRGKEIQELHQIVAMQQKSLDKLTEQNQLLLEDTRRKPSLWQRFKAKFAGA